MNNAKEHESAWDNAAATTPLKKGWFKNIKNGYSVVYDSVGKMVYTTTPNNYNRKQPRIGLMIDKGTVFFSYGVLGGKNGNSLKVRLLGIDGDFYCSPKALEWGKQIPVPRSESNKMQNASTTKPVAKQNSFPQGQPIASFPLTGTLKKDWESHGYKKGDIIKYRKTKNATADGGEAWYEFYNKGTQHLVGVGGSAFDVFVSQQLSADGNSYDNADSKNNISPNKPQTMKAKILKTDTVLTPPTIAGEILEVRQHPTLFAKDGWMQVKKNGEWKSIMSPKTEIEIVPDETPLFAVATPSQFAAQIGNLAGWGYGLYYAHKKGTGFWGYVGYGFLFGIGGYIGGSIIDKTITVAKKK